MKRFTQLAALMLIGAFVVSCGSNSDLEDTEASVFLVANVDLYNPDIDICGAYVGQDVFVETMSISSQPKIPGGTISPNQDVTLTRWVVTPRRTDGGSTASPQWSHDIQVYVPSGGSADLSNYRVYPSEYFDDLPLSNLYPENGGFDPETGRTHIRQAFDVTIYGRTVSGKAISVDVTIAFNFTCGS